MTLRTADVFKCAQCSATLPIEASTVVAICPYCGTHNRVAPEPEPARIPFPEARSPRIPFPEVTVETPESPASTGISPGAIVALVVVALLLGGGILLATLPNGSSSSASESVATEPPRDPRTVQGLWWGHDALCLGDVNGDGVRDVIGLMSGKQLTAVAVDGVTGKFLWATPMNDASIMLCAGDTWSIVGREKFLVSGLDGKTGKPQWETRLSDAVATFSAGPGCLKIVTRDDAVHFLSSSTGKTIDACATTSTMDEDSDLKEEHVWQKGIPIDGSVIRVSETSGTSRFQLDASRDGKSTWSKKLEVSPWPKMIVAPTPHGLVLFGSIPGDANTMVWTHVRASDGEVLFHQEKATDSQVSFDEAVADGDRVFFHVEERLMAADLKSGKELWWVGEE